MKRRDLIKDAVTAWSLSNLWFLGVWRVVLDPPAGGYHLLEPPRRINAAALMLDVLLLAALFWAAAAGARRWLRPELRWPARAIFLLACCAALNGVRAQFYGPLLARNLIAALGGTAFIILTILISGLALLGLARWFRQVVSITQALVLILSPFALMTFSQSAWSLVKPRPTLAAARPESRTAGRVAGRIVWMIFDELDYRAAFAARPSGVELPEFDRLRGQALVAADAYPPAGRTLLSIPALVTGRLVAAARTTRDDELMLTFDGERAPVSWSSQPNLFSRTLAIGGRTAAVGWHHPYCRVIGNDLTRCAWSELANETDRHHPDLSRSMLDYLGRLRLTVPLIRQVFPASSSRGLWLEPEHLKLVKWTIEQGTALVTDRNLSLSLIHIPAPHGPCVYDRRQRDFSIDGRCNYFDNLELADRIFGELRRAMERAGVWDETVVLVSSDHWWRVDQWPSGQSWTAEEEAVRAAGIDRHVPFMLKLKGQEQGSVYHASFNTVLTQDLLLAILRGELPSPPDVSAWLDRHRSIGESPYSN
ncbi:MAG TPA: hypothetical protein VJ302_18835 [Blastocatellia bacterium]|nr:hypothetical protein [Blastocatellia bacterium]